MPVIPSFDLLELRLSGCEIVLGTLLADGERTEATPGDRNDSNCALGEAKEATDIVDGRRAMQCPGRRPSSAVCKMSMRY